MHQSDRLLDGFLEFLGRTEGNLLAGLDVDRFAGGGVAAHARGALADLEDAEADDADALALLQMLGDHGDDVVQDRLGLLLRQFLILGDRRRQVLQRNGGWGRCFLRHSALLVVDGLANVFARSGYRFARVKRVKWRPGAPVLMQSERDKRQETKT